MSWECGICRAVEGRDSVHVESVCHHCGVPLCRDDLYIVSDPAFGSADARHCFECAERHHGGLAHRAVEPPGDR